MCGTSWVDTVPKPSACIGTTCANENNNNNQNQIQKKFHKELLVFVRAFYPDLFIVYYIILDIYLSIDALFTN